MRGLVRRQLPSEPVLGFHRVLDSCLVSSSLRRDSTSAEDVVMLDSVDVMTGVVWMGGVVVGLSVIDC